MFSVVIPVYNHSRYLSSAVVSALRSPLVDEVLLVDDGSRDDSAREIWRLCESNPGRLRNLSEDRPRNEGAHARLDQLVGEARSSWIAVLNSDDQFVPGRFEMLRSILKRSTAELCWGHLIIVDEEGRAIGTKRSVIEPEYPFPSGFDAMKHLGENDLAPLLANQNLIATTSNMVFTRRLHERIGGFGAYRYVHDWDFALRAAAEAETLFTPQYLSCYRAHGRNTISNSELETDREVRAVFEAFERDYSRVAGSPAFQLARAGNRHLVPPSGGLADRPRRDAPPPAQSATT